MVAHLVSSVVAHVVSPLWRRGRQHKCVLSPCIQAGGHVVSPVAHLGGSSCLVGGCSCCPAGGSCCPDHVAHVVPPVAHVVPIMLSRRWLVLSRLGGSCCLACCPDGVRWLMLSRRWLMLSRLWLLLSRRWLMLSRWLSRWLSCGCLVVATMVVRWWSRWLSVARWLTGW